MEPLPHHPRRKCVLLLLHVLLPRHQDPPPPMDDGKGRRIRHRPVMCPFRSVLARVPDSDGDLSDEERVRLSILVEADGDLVWVCTVLWDRVDVEVVAHCL